VPHMPQETVHWELTPAGLVEAERILGRLGRGDA
jgi:hypothetical protein